ncbi:MAG: hypothetical protein FWF84_00950 [Kiritimatiellaeota bacterium]|nr:hypothetical protein [Kiritimatiellota bacterium]
MKRIFFAALVASAVVQCGCANKATEARVPPVPLAALEVGDWALFEGLQAARMERIEVSVKLTVVEKTEDYVIVERHTVNQTAKTVPPERQSFWNSWDESSDRLQFDLRQDYAVWSLFVDPEYDDDYSQTVRQPSNLDVSTAEDIEVAQTTLHAAGKAWTCAHYVFTAPLDLEKPDTSKFEIKTIQSLEEWRHDAIPFGLLRAKCDVGNAFAQLPLYDRTLIDYGNAQTP